MPVEAPVAPAPVVDLPVRTDIDSAPVSGSLKEMLAIAKLGKQDEPPATPPPAPTPEPPATPAPAETPEDRIAKAEATLRQKLFQHKKPRAKEQVETPAQEPVPDPSPTPEPAPSPAPAKAPAKRVAVKDPATEYAERLEKLEQQRLELERQKLELERQRQAAPAPSPQSQPEALKLLSDEERYEYDVFGQMDKLESGKDYQKRFLKSVEATAAYKTKWEKDNAGEAFDPNDSVHDDFFSRNGFKYDKGAFRRAELKLANSDAPQQDINTQRELRELKLKASLSELQPRVMRTAAVTIQAMLNTIDPEIAKAVEAGGPQELMKQFPARGKRVMLAASAVKNFADEAFRLLETDGLIDPDTDRNPIHRLILSIIARQEPMIKSQPLPDQSLEDGRRFATWEQWASMTPAQRAEHWHLGAEEVVDIFSQTQAAQIRDEMGDIDKEIEARAARQTPAPAPAPAQPAPAPRPSPTVGSRSVIDTTNTRTPDNTPPLDKKLRSILFKRSS